MLIGLSPLRASLLPWYRFYRRMPVFSDVRNGRMTRAECFEAQYSEKGVMSALLWR